MGRQHQDSGEQDGGSHAFQWSRARRTASSIDRSTMCANVMTRKKAKAYGPTAGISSRYATKGDAMVAQNSATFFVSYRSAPVSFIGLAFTDRKCIAGGFIATPAHPSSLNVPNQEGQETPNG